MSTFVLVHGGWHGGWCWEKVVSLLQAAGHTVIAPDLPAHGADPTPLSARPYERYVPSLCAVVDAQRGPVILVGHSSGGMMIAAVAGQRPEKVSALVYLAAFLLHPGVAPPEMMRDDADSILAASLVIDHERHVSVVKPECARAVFYADCTDDEAAWATDRLQPEPLVLPGSARVPLPTAGTAHIPRFYIETTQDKALGPMTQRKMYTAIPCAKVYTLPTSHSPFISAPERVVTCLHNIEETLAAPLAPENTME